MGAKKTRGHQKNKEIQHGLLEVTNYPGSKKSAVVFNNRVIITSATLLQPYFEKHTSIYSGSQVDLIANKLKECQIIDPNVDSLKFLNEFNFEVIYDDRDLREKSRNLTRYKSRLAYIFNCPEVAACISNIFNQNNDSNNKDENEKEQNTQELLMSSFIILQQFNQETQYQLHMESFIRHFKTYIRLVESIHKLDDVLTISSPLGRESFYKTINIGKVSNVLGKSNCVFLISNPLTLGCEGSGVFNNKLKLIGLVICTTLRENNEDISLTLVANFQCLFRSFLAQIGRKDKPLCPFWKYSSPAWEKSLVHITNPWSQGTGSFVKILDKKFIITCAHVVREVESTTCQYIDGCIQCDVVWKHPNLDEPYDIALLSVPDSVPNSYFTRISSDRPRLGQSIFNAGFPYFLSMKSANSFNPSIFEGKIVKYTKGMIISDACVQAGQSGSPIWDENGNVLGICVSNLKVDNNIYPQINFAVPIWEIKSFLEDYAKSNDLNVLNNLVAAPSVKRLWKLESPYINSKL